MPQPPNARALAARAVHGVVYARKSLDRTLSDADPAEIDRNLVAELVFGTVRHYFSLRSEVAARLKDPKKPLDPIVDCLLLVGAYQLRHTRIPEYAAVSASVDAVVELGCPWARSLVNAVLRGVARHTAAALGEEARFDQPQWLIDAVRREYSQAATPLLDVCTGRAPMSLRVNQRRQTCDGYRELLSTHGIAAAPGITPDALRLDSPVPVARLPGFDQGWVSVQDEGAQLAAYLVPTAGRMLDACTAPGGKAFHVLERSPAIGLVALDLDNERCERMRAECARLGLDPSFIIRGNALERGWWDGAPFNTILVDAPCSGTGTLRRHPDIRLLKNAADLPAFHTVQRKLLANLWPLLAPGGTMLYCTCSILAIENDAVITAFLDTTEEAEPVPLEGPWGTATKYGRQLLPTTSGPDGFYYARLSKKLV